MNSSTSHEVPATGSEARINFVVHQLNAGPAGADDDFQQMIAQLVQAIFGNSQTLFSRAAHWGVDVFIGSLSDRAKIWDAKYASGVVATGKLRSFLDSFYRTLKISQDRGYVIDSWTLCTPVSLTPEGHRTWERWRDDAVARTGIKVDLWDEAKLRSLLLRPEASQVRRHYYTREVNGAEATVLATITDIWSAIENIASRPAGQVYAERLARLSAISQADIEFSKRIRNNLGHEGHGSVGTTDAIRALEIARDILVKISGRVTPISPSA